MTHLISFSSTRFDVTKETPNPINPLAGESLLLWLREKLSGGMYEVTAPAPEDWGWYVYVKGGEPPTSSAPVPTLATLGVTSIGQCRFSGSDR